MNPAGLGMLGLRDEPEIQGTPFQRAVSDQDQQQVATKFGRALLGEAAEFEFEARNGHRPQSSFIPVLDAAGAVQRVMGLTQDTTERRDDGGEPFLLGSAIDISQRKRAELELTRMMTHDAVTGLKRYVVMRREIDELLVGAAIRSGLALLYVDLDRFRSVNEAMGYEVGDFALKVCAERLRTCI